MLSPICSAAVQVTMGRSCLGSPTRTIFCAFLACRHQRCKSHASMVLESWGKALQALALDRPGMASDMSTRQGGFAPRMALLRLYTSYCLASQRIDRLCTFTSPRAPLFCLKIDQNGERSVKQRLPTHMAPVAGDSAVGSHGSVTSFHHAPGSRSETPNKGATNTPNSG